ncbi:hypothetical protein NDU88_000973 [Pleurodeles waltl]|uniref:Secreted protein n=1 Tax=Pleurodeles waltl TaxID=8319 RepID=A0AAV7Q5N7_PLEWA|nr:hypothetical protein NDU88_000973 [Pleurodeles waltl]
MCVIIAVAEFRGRVLAVFCTALARKPTEQQAVRKRKCRQSASTGVRCALVNNGTPIKAILKRSKRSLHINYDTVEVTPS